MAYNLSFDEEFSFFFRAVPELNLNYRMDRIAPMKDVIESIGVPHTEVGKIISGGEEKDFWHNPCPGESIYIHPVTPPLRVTVPTLLRPEAFQGIRFIADVNVGKLAKLMRLLGFDTAYGNGWSDSHIAERAFDEERIVLTRDRDLLKRKIITYGRLVRSVEPWDQLAEIIHFFGLEDTISPFRICPLCNSKLEKVSKEDVLDHLEPLTRLFVHEFSKCPGCGRIYWAGTHHEKILEKIDSLKHGEDLS